jgi:hypothetical protein
MAVSSAGIFASLVVVVQLQVLIGGPPCGYLCGSATVCMVEPPRAEPYKLSAATYLDLFLLKSPGLFCIRRQCRTIP